MRLRHCFIGKIIEEKREPHELLKSVKCGHITGLDQNVGEECILQVKWQDGTESSIHPSNVEEV